MAERTIEVSNTKVEIFTDKVIKTIYHENEEDGIKEYNNHVDSEMIWAEACSKLPNHVQYKMLSSDSKHVAFEMKRYHEIPRHIYGGDWLVRILSDVLDQIIGLNTVGVQHGDIFMRNIVAEGDGPERKRRHLLIDYGCCRKGITKRSIDLLRIFLTAQPGRYGAVNRKHTYWHHPQGLYSHKCARPLYIDCPLGILLWENRLIAPEKFRAVFDEFLFTY